MRVEWKLLHSRVSLRIVGLFLVAALVPALILGTLTYRAVHRSILEQQQKELVEASRSYALAVFGRLLLARSIAEGAGEATDGPPPGPVAPGMMFTQATSVKTTAAPGVNAGNGGNAAIPLLAPASGRKSIAPPQLLVRPPATPGAAPSVSLAILKPSAGRLPFLVGLQPLYLWGNQDDISAAFNICVYASDGMRLHCGYPDEASAPPEDRGNAGGSWRLFLKPEFGNGEWTFVASRRFPARAADLSAFLDVFIAVAASSVLLITLLSLMQIRRTMVPLERLIAGARRIAAGDFSAVDVRSQDEFGELATAVNTMSTRIKGQLTALQTLTAIDDEMLRQLSLHKVFAMVGDAMRAITPGARLLIAHCSEDSNGVGYLYMQAPQHRRIEERRIELSPSDIAILQGDVPDGDAIDSRDARPLFLPPREAGTHGWRSGLMWQGRQFGILLVEWPASEAAGRHVEEELGELANRIAIVIKLNQREQRLLYQARFDSLTGLLNRRGFEEKIEAAAASDARWAIFFVDIDRFKMVNDTMGHKAGDELLKDIAVRLRHAVPDGVAARLGGDEFLLLVPDDGASMTIDSSAQALLAALALPFHIGSQVLQMTCSIGIAQHPSDVEDGHTIIERADIAVYRAKQLGRNNFQFYDAQLNAEGQARLQMEADMRLALECGEFVLQYQPKVDLHTGRIASAEALVRWRHPQKGMVPPLSFISLAEETGLIVPLGAWVMRTACLQNMAWRQAGIGPLRIAVNVSARQFARPDFVETVSSILRETGLPADGLEIELTESMVMEDVGNAIGVMTALRDLGVLLSIDDFGTGFSSLAYLKRFPISVLKVDQSFVRDIEKDDDSRMIVLSIIDLAHNLKLKVVAEGVETASQFDYLRSRGCDEIQGYFFSRPLDAAAFAALYGKHGETA